MVTIRLLVVCLELITLPICSFFLSCSVHCERLVSSLQPVFIPSLSFFPGVELCTCARSQRPEGHVGYSSVTTHFVPLRQGLFLPFFPSLSLPLLVRLAARKSQQLSCLQPFSSGVTGVCRTRSSFCLGTGIQMAVFMLEQQTLLITKPSLYLWCWRLNPGPCAPDKHSNTSPHPGPLLFLYSNLAAFLLRLGENEAAQSLGLYVRLSWLSSATDLISKWR